MDKNLLSQQRTNLAIKRTKLANQRTLLAYMRTGFAIAGLAGTFRKTYIAYFGISMILLSAFQYIVILQETEQKVFINKFIDYFPLIFVPLSLIALYLEFYR